MAIQLAVRARAATDRYIAAHLALMAPSAGDSGPFSRSLGDVHLLGSEDMGSVARYLEANFVCAVAAICVEL